MKTSGENERRSPQGEEFWRRRRGQSVGALYDRMRSTMPVNQAGTLSDPEYAAIVRFILRANEMPPGRKELPAELVTRRRMQIVRQPERP